MEGNDSKEPIEVIMDELGCGRYQLVAISLIVLAKYFDMVGSYIFIFTTLDTGYRCRIPECEGPDAQFNTSWLVNALPHVSTSEFDKCSRYALYNESAGSDDCSLLEFNKSSTIRCTEWVYDHGGSIVPEFELACEYWKTALIGTLNGVGQLICLTYIGFFSDRFGRRTIMVYSTVIKGVIGTIQSFSPSYLSYTIFEILNTALSAGLYTSGYVLSVELLPAKHRVKVLTIMSFLSSFGPIIRGLLAFWIPYWRLLLRAIYIPAIVFISFYSVIPESVRWLLVRQRFNDTVHELITAAQQNRIQFSDRSQKIIADIREGKVSSHVKETRQIVPFMAILGSPRLVLRLIVCAFSWITIILVYYSLNINSVNISSDNIYLNYLLVSGSEIVAMVMFYLLIDKLGRRISLSGSLVLCSLACLVYTFVSKEQAMLKLIVYLAAKFFVSFAISVVYIFTSEMFPTTLRHTCMGCCAMLGRIGNIVAPQTRLMSDWHSSLPMSLFAGLALVSGVMALIFPETLGKQLPQTVEDAENIQRPIKM